MTLKSEYIFQTDAETLTDLPSFRQGWSSETDHMEGKTFHCWSVFTGLIQTATHPQNGRSLKIGAMLSIEIHLDQVQIVFKNVSKSMWRTSKRPTGMMYIYLCLQWGLHVWRISICVSGEDYRYDVYLSVSPVRITGVTYIYLCLRWGLQVWCTSICVSGEDYRCDARLSVSPVRITGMMYIYLCLQWGLQVWCISICVSSEDYRYDVYLSVSSEDYRYDVYLSVSPVKITGLINIYLCLRWGLQVWCKSICVSSEEDRYDV